MKLVLFDEDFKLGVLKNGNIVDVSASTVNLTYYSPQEMMNQVIENFDSMRGEIETIVSGSEGVPRDDIRLRAPLPKPTRLVCMAGNYMESGTLSERPPKNGFNKSPNSVIGNEGTIILPDVAATIFEHEAELALVIGKTASNVKAEEAFDYIFGYMNFIDVSARGVPAFYQMKARETFAPMGPWICTADEVADPQNLDVKLWVNGNLMQDFNTDDMAHQIPQIVEWVSSIHTLEPGDVIATGTNHRGLSPLHDGDKIEIESEGLGRLNVSVRDDLKRTWARETRFDREERGLQGPTPQLTGKYA